MHTLLEQNNSTFNFSEFRDKDLLKTSASTRDATLAAMDEEMAKRGDQVIAQFFPDETAAFEHCSLDRRAWYRQLRDHRNDIALWSIGFIIASAVLVGLLTMAWAGEWLFASVCILLVGVSVREIASLFSAPYAEFKKLRAEGHTGGAKSILRNHGSNVWRIGRDGLYIGHDIANAPSDRIVSFHSYEKLRMPRVDEVDSRIVVTLLDDDGDLVRVMVLPLGNQPSLMQFLCLLKDRIFPR